MRKHTLTIPKRTPGKPPGRGIPSCNRLSSYVLIARKNYANTGFDFMSLLELLTDKSGFWINIM